MAIFLFEKVGIHGYSPLKKGQIPFGGAKAVVAGNDRGICLGISARMRGGTMHSHDLRGNFPMNPPIRRDGENQQRCRGAGDSPDPSPMPHRSQFAGGGGEHLPPQLGACAARFQLAEKFFRFDVHDQSLAKKVRIFSKAA
jgi:hypothetical protein